MIWYLGAQNDALYIINMPPRPISDHPWHDRPDGPTLVIPVHGLSDDTAQRIVDAHNKEIKRKEPPMPVYDCGDPLCESCRREFGPGRNIAIAERNSRIENTPRIERYNRHGSAIYDKIAGVPVYFFATERDAQMCMTLMEAVAR